MYRLLRGERKRKLKLLHASLMSVIFVLTVCGLKAAFDSHNQVRIPSLKYRPIELESLALECPPTLD